jgi:uncharacterized protein YcbX
MSTVTALYRYPVKGFTPEPLETVDLTPGEAFPFDRAYAVAHGDTVFDPAAPAPLPKYKFAMLMRNERIAALRTRFDETTRSFLVTSPDGREQSFKLEAADGRAGLAAFIDGYLTGEMRAGAKVVSAPGQMFSDVPQKYVSLINVASCAALDPLASQVVDPLRFRANVYFSGIPAWEELGWVGRTLRVGTVELTVTKRIVRCAATNVNPDTAARDLEIPALLAENFGHSDNGIYAQVTRAGTIRPGDRIAPV